MKKILFTSIILASLLTPMLFARGSGSSEKPYIAVVSKGEQHDFWQQVKRGATDAAQKYGVDMTFEGPPSESDVQIQVEMLNNAMAKAPVAIALAALDTKSVLDQLKQLKSQKIPVVGFDSGVPEAPEGSIVANASTNNYAAAGVAAKEMFDLIKGSLSGSESVKFVVMNQDATGESILSRGKGFRDAMIKLLTSAGIAKSDIAVIGNPAYIANDSPTSGEKVLIEMIVPASSSNTDVAASSSAVLNKVDSDNILGIFASNEATAKGLLAATNDGAALADSGLVVIGYDAGAGQKNAVRQGYFAGSITQDPYAIGYKAIELAYKAYNGQPVSDIDTGAKFYTAENMDNPDIAPLLYD